MAELINSNAALGFSFGLVEVALYGFDDGALAVQPRVVAKTRLIERSVVVLQDDRGVSALSEPDPSSLGTAGKRSGGSPLGEGEKQAAYRAWWEPITSMAFDDPDQEPPKLYWPNNVRANLPWPKVWLLAASSAGNKKCAVWLIEGGEDKTLLPLLAERQEELLDQLPPGAFAQVGKDGYTYYGLERPWSEFGSEDEKKTWIAEALNAFVNVFRQAIKELAAAT
jgi:hypothetical protein